jgi:hypothetical protein
VLGQPIGVRAASKTFGIDLAADLGAITGVDGVEKRELFPNAVDGRDNLSGDSFSVDEHDAVDQVF